MLVISGPPGVGKTTVAWRAFSRCADGGRAPGMADLDLLGAAWPAPEDDQFQSRLKARNLAAVWANFRAGGSERLIVAAVIETADERELLRSAIDGDLFLCRLSASESTLRGRIQARGRELGDDLAKLLRRADELSTLLRDNDVSDLVVDTDGLSVDAVAAMLLDAWEVRIEHSKASTADDPQERNEAMDDLIAQMRAKHGPVDEEEVAAILAEESR